jgi:hypothetical protein
MTELQITSWRDIPSFVAAREGSEVIKISLPARFQEAIDEAAMRLGDSGADAYMEGWSRGPWMDVEGSASHAAESAAADLEARWTTEALATLLDSYGPRA